MRSLEDAVVSTDRVTPEDRCAAQALVVRLDRLAQRGRPDPPPA